MIEDVTGVIGEYPNAIFLQENYVASSTKGITDDDSSSNRRRMRFNMSFKISMFQSISLTGANIAQHGEMQIHFEHACTYFIKSSSNCSSEDAIKPTWKTLNYRFKNIVVDRRQIIKLNSSISGITEVLVERKLRFEDITERIDEAFDVIRAGGKWTSRKNYISTRSG